MAGPLINLKTNLTVAGTAREITAAKDVKASKYILRANPDNVGDLYVGDSDIDNTFSPLAPGESIIESIGGGDYIDLFTIFFDGDTTDDDLDIWYRPA